MTMMTAAFSETAYAKINLALHVRRRMANGYHELETIFAFLDRGDTIYAATGPTIDLQITGRFGDELDRSDNLAIAAAQILSDHIGGQHGVALTLDKQLPIASGIGGGSADAAATLRLLNRFWDCNLSTEELAQIAKPLGADVPACVVSQTRRGTGIGQELDMVDAGRLSTMFALLVNPLIPISTARIFADWHGNDGGAIHGSDALAMALDGRNDLEPSAKAQLPIIADLIDRLSRSGAALARMSGSGATCFGLFDDYATAKRAESVLLKEFNSLWTMIGRIR